eukprot:scaffold71649_cov60-Phaeocystis_antarctica.AAC.3
MVKVKSESCAGGFLGGGLSAISCDQNSCFQLRGSPCSRTIPIVRGCRARVSVFHSASCRAMIAACHGRYTTDMACRSRRPSCTCLRPIGRAAGGGVAL